MALTSRIVIGFVRKCRIRAIIALNTPERLATLKPPSANPLVVLQAKVSPSNHDSPNGAGDWRLGSVTMASQYIAGQSSYAGGLRAPLP
jgi:hypothetical protein